MSVIVRLQNLPWSANAGDIRAYFHGLSIPEGGVHIVGGELGDVFIAFSTDEDARQAMLRDGGKIKEIKIKLYLSSRTEMQKIIDQARHQGMAAAMQQQYVIPNMPQQMTQNMGQHMTHNIGQHMAQNMSQPMPQNITSAMTQNISANLGQNLSNMTHQLPMPNMGISNPVPMGNIPNISSMQVPLQNVQPIAAMVNKPEEQPIVPPAPPVGVLQLQTDTQPIQTVNSETDKEKRDRKDRRRRSRSRSRGNSGSKSRSRSVSRSRSRSKDRKGRDRDRYYDRRRRRSRSRDRRRRRDRSRSYERSSRDKRRNDYRKEESEENSSARWSNNQQSRNQTSKGKSNDTHNNRSQSFKDIYSDQRGGGANTKRQFPPNSNNQNNNSNNSANVPRQSSSSSFKEEKPNSSLNKNNSLSDTATSVNSEPKPEVSDNTNSQNQNPFGPFTTSFPPFNPQHMVSYPSFNQNIMGNNGQLNRQQNSQEMQESKSNQEKQNLEKPSNESSQRNFNMPSNNQQNQNFNNFKPFNNSEMKPNIFSNEQFMPPNNIGFNWGAGFPMGGNMGFPFPIQQQNLNNDQQIKANNAPSEKIPNTCVQIKNVPMNTSYEQVKEFFRQSLITNDCLKIIRTNNGMFIYVRFKSLHDKKQAILRSGCLLNNSIASVLHVDDNVFENAVDPMHSTMYGSQSDPYNKPKPVAMESGTSNLESEKKTIPELGMQTDNAEIYNCIKIEGTARNHPFFTNNHRIYAHIRNLCDKFKPIDLCVKKTNGKYVFGYIMFDAKVDIENIIRSLSNAKIEGKQVAITKCTEDEFNSNSEDNMPLDKNKFLSFISKPESKTKTDSGSKTQTKSSRFSDNTDEISENSRNEMETVKHPEPNVSRNKVLLPTPDVLPVKEVDMLPPTNCVLIQNLPFDIDQTIIVEFFSDINIVPAQIHIMLDPNGKPIGDAYCEFENYEEATCATNKNNCMLGDSQVVVNLVSRDEMMKACSVNVSPQNTNSFPNQDYFNGPPGPPPLFNMRLEQPPNWNMPFNPSGPPEPMIPPDQMGSYDDEYNVEDDDDSNGYGYNNSRGNSRGLYRGGHGNNFDRGGRGFNRGGGRGRDHGGFNRDNDNFDRGFGNFRGRGGRGGSDQEGRMSDRGGRGRGGFERGRGGFERGGRGFDRGGNGFDRGNKGFERGGKGFDRGGRGFDRVGRGFDRGERGSFSRGGARGRGRDMNEGFDRPRSLMSIGQDLRGSPSQMPIQDESVLEFGQPGCVIAAENIPYRADINDILDFFSDFQLTPECVIRRYDDHGKVTGDARISFENPSEARRAVKSLDNKYIGNRKVSLSFFN